MLSKTQQVWRHLVCGAIERGQRRWPSVTALARELGMGVSTVHAALEHPVEIGAVRIRPAGGVRVVDPGRLLLVWAGPRRLSRDITNRFHVTGSAPAVERMITNPTAVLGGFGAVVAHIGGNTIADYETVLVYGDPRISSRRRVKDSDPQRVTEVLVAEADPLLAGYGRVTPLTQAWVDLFSLRGWQASRFVHALLPRLVTDAVTEAGLLSA
ncbi:MAG: hypothetical protein ACRD0A_16340 [Acidimicrobiales bacterium]